MRSVGSGGSYNRKTTQRSVLKSQNFRSPVTRKNIKISKKPRRRERPKSFHYCLTPSQITDIRNSKVCPIKNRDELSLALGLHRKAFFRAEHGRKHGLPGKVMSLFAMFGMGKIDFEEMCAISLRNIERRKGKWY
jgi:hypothetical protein